MEWWFKKSLGVRFELAEAEQKSCSLLMMTQVCLSPQKYSSAPPHVSSRHNFSNPQSKETSVCIPKKVEYSQDVNC